MDPTTADFNAWLAEEGAKVGATVPPQPSNLLAMYGTGYVPADTAHEPTTADILARAQARDAGFPGFLRRVSDAIPESGRHLDPRGPDEGLLAYWKRAADALSVHDMAKGGLNTAANWLDGSRGTGHTAAPGEGYSFAATGLEPSDVLAPTGGVVAGAAVGTKALNKPSLTDSARARYLEWKHPDDLPTITGGDALHPDSATQMANADKIRSWPNPTIKDAAYPTQKPYDADHTIANERGTPRDRFRLLADDQASTPGLLLNSLPMREASRLNRAREMGFDTGRTLYHGSIEPKPFDAFDLSHTGRNMGNEGFYGRGVYSTNNKADAEFYSGYGDSPGHVRKLYSRAQKPFVIDYDNFPAVQKLAAQIYPDAPLEMGGFMSREHVKGWTEALKRHGYDAVEVKGRGADHEWVDLDPRNLRDTKAAFNLADSDKAGLLLSDQSRATVPGTVINSLVEAGYEPGWYHGTRTGGFSEFSTDDALRANSNNGFRGVSMTRDPNEASGYTGVEMRPEFRYSKDTLAQKLGLKEPTRSTVEVGHDYGHGKGAVYPLAVKAENPFIWDIDDFSRPGNDTLRRVKEVMPDYSDGGDFPVKQRAALSDALLRAGYDAIDIVSGGKVRERAAFKKGSVKSATTGDTLFSDTTRSSVPGTVVNAQEDYGQRNDGTPKGAGFLGELQRPDGGVSTEISVGVNIGGKEMEIPLLVPTLTQQEIRYLLENNPNPRDIPESIMQKAYDHAVGRLGKGLSPFAD